VEVHGALAEAGPKLEGPECDGEDAAGDVSDEAEAVGPVIVKLLGVESKIGEGVVVKEAGSDG